MPAFNSPFVTSVRQLKHVLREMDLDNTGEEGGKCDVHPWKIVGRFPWNGLNFSNVHIYLYTYIYIYIYIHIYIWNRYLQSNWGSWPWPLMMRFSTLRMATTGVITRRLPHFQMHPCGHMLLSVTCHRRDLRTVIGADTPMTCFVRSCHCNKQKFTNNLVSSIWLVNLHLELWLMRIWSQRLHVFGERLADDLCSTPRESRFATAVA